MRPRFIVAAEDLYLSGYLPRFCTVLDKGVPAVHVLAWLEAAGRVHMEEQGDQGKVVIAGLLLESTGKRPPMWVEFVRNEANTTLHWSPSSAAGVYCTKCTCTVFVLPILGITIVNADSLSKWVFTVTHTQYFPPQHPISASPSCFPQLRHT